MARPRRKAQNATGASYEIRVVGVRRRWFGDWYHFFLRFPWSAVLALLSLAFLALNALFAFVFEAVGGITNARPGSFVDAFFFSVQTMGTIGYGAMYPSTTAANVVVVAESVVSLVFTALATGLIFAKFARPVGRVQFSRHATIAPMDGVPALSFRVGNQRGNNIVEARVNVSLVRTIRTAEGVTFYKMIDLKLSRERSPAVARSWNVIHMIEPGSPLHGATPESLAKEDAELLVTLAGTDDTSYQPVFARHTYENPSILWGARHADVLSETPEGDLVLDVRRFHEIEATVPTAEFPYPAAKPPAAA
jgi:inward rectifier potassium channel